MIKVSALDLATLHSQTLTESLLTHLPLPLLNVYYKLLTAMSETIIVTFSHQQKLVGFLLATTYPSFINLVLGIKPHSLPVLQFLAVKTKFQRQGIGTKLIQNLNQLLVRKNIQHYVVLTKINSKSQAFYIKLGFTPYSTNRILGIKYYLSPQLTF